MGESVRVEPSLDLVWREAETELLDALIDGLRERGGALVLRGERGIGIELVGLGDSAWQEEGGHLYRIFPKLDITARTQLRDA